MGKRTAPGRAVRYKSTAFSLGSPKAADSWKLGGNITARYREKSLLVLMLSPRASALARDGMWDEVDFWHQPARPS